FDRPSPLPFPRPIDESSMTPAPVAQRFNLATPAPALHEAHAAIEALDRTADLPPPPQTVPPQSSKKKAGVMALSLDDLRARGVPQATTEPAPAPPRSATPEPRSLAISQPAARSIAPEKQAATSTPAPLRPPSNPLGGTMELSIDALLAHGSPATPFAP